MWRYQPPTWSPVTAEMIWRGLKAAAGSGGAGAGDSLAHGLIAESGARRVLLTGSGTEALTLAVIASGQARPRVALPAWGCPDLATAADGADAVVLLYDLDPRTLAPDLDSLARAVGSGADAIVVAPFFGLPAAPEPVRSLASAAGALVIDDAAQGAGGSWLGRPLGTHGDLGVISFGRGKGRTGGSGGGLLATSDRGVTAFERIADRALANGGPGWREVAILTGLWLLARPSLYRIPASLPFLRLGESIYHQPRTPEAMKPLAAAVLLAGQPAANREAAGRRELGRWWLEQLRGSGRVGIVEPAAGADPGWLRFPVIVPADRIEEFAGLEMRALGVMPGYPMALSRLPGFDRRVEPTDRAGWPGAELLAARLFTLPTHSRLGQRDRDRLLALILGRGVLR